MNPTTIDRFEAKVERVPESGCWLWTGCTNAGGYGRFGAGLAHRAAYAHYRGPIPAGLDLDHLCRVRCCVNPAHLEAVTRRENLLRGEGLTAIHAAKAHCPAGHAFTPENTLRNTHGHRQCRRCHREWQRLRYQRTR